MAHQWFESYITNRLSFACISKHTSPQGSVLSFSTSTSSRFLANTLILISTLTLMTYKFTLDSLIHPNTVLIESLTVFLIYLNGLIVIL